MNLGLISRIIGLFALGFSLTMLPPLALSVAFEDGETGHFALSMAAILLVGLVFWLPAKRNQRELAGRDGFVIVALFWSGISALASLPFVLGAHMSLVDAMFESVSAFTTTGATVMLGLDDMPRSMLFYRQQLQWFGGMGMIVLALAVLPVIGVGGMQLYKAEAPGPFKDEKLTPRLAHTAQLLWIIYVIITALNAVAYWLAGMDVFDAVAHALSTVSTGGFSTHDASLAYFHSSTIEAIAVCFMLLGAINFSVHYLALRRHSLHPYARNLEVRVFLLVVGLAVLVVSLMLYHSDTYASLPPDLRNATFEVVSVITSTGFGTVDFTQWPTFLPVFLILLSFIGGCGGSTAGGIKVMRIYLLVQMGYREVRRLVHPRAVFTISVEGNPVPTRTVEAIWGFLSVYVTSFCVLMLLIMQTGLDQVSSFSAIATCMNNLGPGLGEVATSFATVSDAGKVVAIVAMLLGRLEVFTLLVLLTPAFWRR